MNIKAAGAPSLRTERPRVQCRRKKAVAGTGVRSAVKSRLHLAPERRERPRLRAEISDGLATKLGLSNKEKIALALFLSGYDFYEITTTMGHAYSTCSQYINSAQSKARLASDPNKFLIDGLINGSITLVPDTGNSKPLPKINLSAFERDVLILRALGYETSSIPKMLKPKYGKESQENSVRAAWHKCEKQMGTKRADTTTRLLIALSLGLISVQNISELKKQIIVEPH